MRALTLIAVVSMAIAGLVALAWWEGRWECIRTATRIDASDTGSYLTTVCMEYACKKPPTRTNG